MLHFSVYIGYVYCVEAAVRRTCTNRVADDAVDFWYVSNVGDIMPLVPQDCPLLQQLSGKVIPFPPGPNGRHFADVIIRCIFVNEKFFNLIKILVKFVSKGPIDDNPVLV